MFGFSLMLSLEPFIIRLSEKEEIDMAQNRVRIADVADAFVSIVVFIVVTFSLYPGNVEFLRLMLEVTGYCIDPVFDIE